MQRRRIVELLVLLVGTGCGDDDVGSTASGSETEASSTGASATSPTTSISESATTTGTETEGTDTEPTDTDTDPSSSSESSSSGEPNEPPVAADDEYVVFLSAMPLSIDDAAGLLANDVDPDDDALTVSAFDDPSSLGVVVDVQGSGAFTYGDGPWWGGPDAFGYTISDGRGGEATANVDLLVIPDLVPLSIVVEGVGGFAINGIGENNGAGYSVAAAGDVDGDGLGDVVIGVPGANAAYVVFGKADGDPVDLADVLAGLGGGFAILAEGSEDGLGTAVAAAGDVNGDGMADVIVGAPESDASLPNAGRSYVVLGKSEVSPVDLVDVVGGVDGFAIDGQANADRSGSAVAGVGDMNGDGLDDIAVGAAAADPNGGSSGRAWVVFGQDAGALVSLASVTTGTGGFAINGELADDGAGTALAGVGDVNGDLVPDLVVGAPFHDTAGLASGRVYVVHGKGDGALVELASIAAGTGGFALDGEAASDFAGSALGPAGDVDGDGFADFVVAARGNDAGGTNTGRAYVVFGNDDGTLLGLVDVAGGTGGWSIEAPGTAATNLAVAGGGDVNGDGTPDVVVGAVPPSAGRTYVVHGKGDGAAVDPADLVQGSGGFAIDGEQKTDLAGFSVGMGGDVNGDGFADLVIGAWGFPGGAAQGRTYVVFGSPTSLE